MPLITNVDTECNIALRLSSLWYILVDVMYNRTSKIVDLTDECDDDCPGMNKHIEY